jgi:hypothetical protein
VAGLHPRRDLERCAEDNAQNVGPDATVTFNVNN